MKLSKNLSLAEVIKSGQAIKRGIDNTPTDLHTKNLKTLAKEVFQKIRDHFEKPIYVSSGYRSPELNSALGGSKTSQHMKGQAIDIDQDNTGSKINNRQIFDYIREELDFDQAIAEYPKGGIPAWVHVSYVSPEKNRKEVLVCYKAGNRTCYKKYEDVKDLYING